VENLEVRALDWGKLSPLRLRARSVADGVYAGSHRSLRRGEGIEFGGHRNYLPGDDLRWLGRHALMRHGQLLIREFETETDRVFCLVVDASASMAYSSGRGPGAKLAYAGLIAAALARVALLTGDPVSLDWIGGRNLLPIPTAGGHEAFERILGALESVRAGGDLRTDLASVERSLALVARRAKRGSSVLLLSDFLDLPEGTLERFVALGAHRRTIVGLGILDPAEAEFPFTGPIRLRASEGSTVVETDGATARSGYLANLERVNGIWNDALVERGGKLVRATTLDDPVSVVLEVLRAIRGHRP
jgi:uncharacterized protein (DUF58 family)